jgi:hypothetical protein
VNKEADAAVATPVERRAAADVSVRHEPND